jgi:hypothetical protein
MNKELIKFIENYWKYITPFAVLFMAYMQTQFVGKTEFQAHAEKIFSRVEKIEQILIRMESGAETDKRHDQTLTDHETRIRTLENPKPSH